MRVAVTGASGFIGSALLPALRGDGHDVVRLVRRAPKAADERHWDGRNLDPRHLDGVAAVIHLAGANIGTRRWTKARKRVLRDSRVLGTEAVARAVAAAGTPLLVSSSASGWYGDTEDRPTDETGPPGEGFLAELCREWEAATAAAASAGARVVHPRSGIVLGRGGGALRPQLLLAKVGMLAPLGSGRQWVSWISLPDQVAALRHLLTADVRGAVNVVSPVPITNADYTKVLNRVLRRPTPRLHVPRPALRLVLGEFADDALRSQRLVPAVLSDSGFRFRHQDLETALRAVLARG